MMKKFDSDNYFDSLKANCIYIIFLLPSFLNETKASFIYLLFYFLLLTKINLKTVLKLLVLSPVLFGVFVGLFYMYSVITKQNIEELTDLDFYEESDGGVTISGGEGLSQPRFVEALVKNNSRSGLFFKYSSVMIRYLLCPV